MERFSKKEIDDLEKRVITEEDIGTISGNYEMKQVFLEISNHLRPKIRGQWLDNKSEILRTNLVKIADYCEEHGIPYDKLIAEQYK